MISMLNQRFAKKSTLSRHRRLTCEPLESRRLMAVTIFDDALQPPFQDWSWGTSVDLSNTSPVQSGARSVAVTHDSAWGGMYFGSSQTTTISQNEEIRFQIHGGTGGQQLQVFVADPTGTFIPLGNLTPAANQWTEVVLDFEAFAAPNGISGFAIQDAAGSPQATYYVDAVEVIDVIPEQPNDPVQGPSITVDPSSVIREISEGVYGLNFADPDFADEIDLPVNRWGGNSTTRYNYQLDATNLASDWYFENYPADTPDVSLLPAGSTANIFVDENEQSGSETIMTIGMVGWTPNSRDIQGSFPVDVYGPQQSVDPYFPNFGNGVRTNGDLITGNDPSITSIPIDEQFATGWVEHLVSQHGTAANGGVQYYALDNEPMLWNSTHRDVHPDPAGYDEVLEKGIAYANAIKTADPTAETLGPVSWGWTAYFYSALDAAAGGEWWLNPQDRNAHGGQAFVPWYLEQMAAAETQYGTRLLDYLDLHYYPQDPGVALGPAGDLATQQKRLQSTRSLWDPNYVDTSWINDTVQLVPRMRDWVDNHYPGTKLAITEYQWGGNEHISGALAQADVLGIFGREGVDLATMWAPPEPNQPAAFAFRMFRNYDGLESATSQFGEKSLAAESTDVDDVSVFAAQRAADGALTITLINKSTNPQITPIQIDGITSANAEVFTYDSKDLGQIVQGPNLQISGGQAELTLPAYSITLLEIPGNRTGDFNGDGLVNAADIDALCIEINSGTHAPEYDLTNDGLVNAADRDAMIFDVLDTLYGDANLDRVVDGLDFIAWNNHKFSGGAGWAGADFDCDGVTDGRDFIIWNDNKFQSAAAPFQPIDDLQDDGEEDDGEDRFQLYRYGSFD